MIRNRVELIVVALILIVIGSFLAVWISRAQIAAQKIASKNNLRQIGLAVHNYESTYRKLPSGCDELENHGWMTFIYPYVEASAWYSHVDLDLAWEHPLNRQQFKFFIPTYCVPGHEPNFTSDGYGITGYQANPALLYKTSAVKFSDLTAGPSNIWLAGEINCDHKPFGYPFNWRELNQPINSGETSFGAWADGANFVLADGSITFLSVGIDSLTFHQFATAAPLPEESLYQFPNRKFSLAFEQLDRRVRFFGKENGRHKGGPPFSQVWLDANGSPEFIDFVNGLIEIEQVIEQYRKAKTLRIAYPRDAKDLELICSLKELETLGLMSDFVYPNTPKPTRILASELLSGLRQLTKLKYLKLEASEDELKLIKEGLPYCEVVASSHFSPNSWR